LTTSKIYYQKVANSTLRVLNTITKNLNQSFISKK